MSEKKAKVIMWTTLIAFAVIMITFPVG
jgi:hypothetical protein